MVEVRYHGTRHTVRLVSEVTRHNERYIEVELGFSTKWLHSTAIVKG